MGKLAEESAKLSLKKEDSPSNNPFPSALAKKIAPPFPCPGFSPWPDKAKL